MDLSTTYMGIKMKNPIIIGSSGLTGTLENIKKCADSGAGAIVLKSLFEEQIIADKNQLFNQEDMYFWYPEAVDYISDFTKEQGIRDYLRLIDAAKKVVNIPIFGSINCITPNEWPEFAMHMEDAGADGVELNIAIPPSNIASKNRSVEEIFVEIIHAVKRFVSIPIALKLGYYFTNLPNTLEKMDKAGVQALVLFNRFYYPDIDIDHLKISSGNIYSAREENLNSLRWIALMSEKLQCDISASTGMHTSEDIIKEILVGAEAVQLCTTLYKNGIGHISKLLEEVKQWMAQQGFGSINDFKGMLAKGDEIAASFERVHFMHKNTGKID